MELLSLNNVKKRNRTGEEVSEFGNPKTRLYEDIHWSSLCW
jgi:hypothetical protein